MKNKITVFLTILLAFSFAEVARTTVTDEATGIQTNTYFEGDKEIAKEIYTAGKLTTKTGNIPDGIVKEYYPGGKVKTEFPFKNNKREGERKTYYESGELQYTAQYKNDELDGPRKELYKSGKISSEGACKNGIQDGAYKYYYENGKLKTEIPYNGKVTGYYDTGEVEYEVPVKSGKSEGTCTFYYKNKKIKRICTYINDLLDGVSTFYNEEGGVSSTLSFKAGEPVGNEIDYYKSGKLLSEMSKDGAGKFYYESGKLMSEGKCKNYKLDGPCKSFLENGTLEWDEYFVDGLREGLNIKYHDNGKVLAKVYYKEDNIQGLIIFNSRSGIWESVSYYHNGEPIIDDLNILILLFALIVPFGLLALLLEFLAGRKLKQNKLRYNGLPIEGIGEHSLAEIQSEINNGGKFVVYQYNYSAIVLSFKRPTRVVLLKQGDRGFVRGIRPSIISLCIGLWGFPWGIIWCFESLFINFKGGTNVTESVLASIINQLHPQNSPTLQSNNAN